ncbi:MAG: N-acetylmuramoyl-L-alanine amidase [Sphingobacteriia bacterium]|nr:N-acetylmuramoyl-L-alanine amidase [Sphingobacteriia bacterium]
MKRFEPVFLVLLVFTLNSAVVSGQPGQGNLSVETFTVVLDAGHGGYDPGAKGPHSVEKDITLTIVKMTEKILADNQPDVKVILTRTDDTFITLNHRAKIANENNADLFISVHCNSNPDKNFSGAETYVMGLHKSDENLEVAKIENAIILTESDHKKIYDGFDPHADEDYIMLTMIQSASMNKSLDFAQLVQDEIAAFTGLRNRGVMQAGFVVLYHTTMPGVLVETGFLTNPSDEKLLLDEANQHKIALAVAKAVSKFREIFPNSLQIHDLKETTDNNKVSSDSTRRIYRIWFTSYKKNKKPAHFKNLPNLWSFSNENGFHYTFDSACTVQEINQKIDLHIKNKRIKKRWMKSLKILETEDNKIISILNPESR